MENSVIYLNKQGIKTTKKDISKTGFVLSDGTDLSTVFYRKDELEPILIQKIMEALANLPYI